MRLQNRMLCRRAERRAECAEAGSRAQDFELHPDSWDLAEGVEGGCQEAIAEFNERMCKARRGRAGGT